MRVSSGTANSDRNAQTVPFLKKIERKRKNFQKPIQNLLKMAMVMSDLIPVRARLSWEMSRVDDLVVFTQAFQQLVMGLEVAVDRGEISEETYMKMLREFLPAMKSIEQEKKDIEADKKKAQKEAAAAQAALPPPLVTPQLSPNPRRPISTSLDKSVTPTAPGK
jgi:CTP synthase (UTP-ammonia lyase)